MPNTPPPFLHDDPRRDAVALLVDTALALRTFADRCAREHGTTRAQWGLLARLARRDGLTQAELAEMLDIQPISLTRLVDRLDEQGLVERRPHPSDRRANQVFLTPAGRGAFEAFTPLANTMAERIFAGVDAEAVDGLRAVLAHIKSNVKCAMADRKAAETAPELQSHVG